MITVLPGTIGTRWPDRLSWLRWSSRADLVLAMVCCLAGLIEVAVHDDGVVTANVVSMALSTLPIAWRQRAPLTATIMVGLSWVVLRWWGSFSGLPLFELATFPVSYSLGAHANLLRAVCGAAVLLTAIAVSDLRDLGFFTIQFALLWLAGRSVRAYRLQSEQLRSSVSRLAEEREVGERLAVAQERQRIANELHDVMAHAVSLMVIQAGGAEHTLAREPDRARAALVAVQDHGREVIAELRRVLCLVRGAAEVANFGFTPPTPFASPAAWRGLAVRSVWVDAALAAGVVLVAGGLTRGPRVDTGLTLVVSAIAAALVILCRRSTPLGALFAATTATIVELLLYGRDLGLAPLMATMVAMYSAGTCVPARRSVLAAVVVGMAISGLVLVKVGAGSAVVCAVWLGIPWFGGRHVRAYGRRAEQLASLTARLAGERDARARLAVVAERARLSRELHDSLAHAVSIMVLQAGAAEKVLATSPKQALDAIRAVESQGRQAHYDLRRLLGVLDCCDEAGLRAPQPSLSQLGALIEQVKQAGLPVTLQVHGQPAPLPTGLDISAYRIVQESLTNTVKHAGLVRTTVTICYRRDSLDIEIHNLTRDRQQRSPNDGGHGMIGMRERVSLYGGTLETDFEPGDGFRVHAHLPLEPAVR